MEETTNEIEITEEEMMAVARAMAHQTREPGEMTAAILSRQSGMTRELALIRLNHLYEDGLLEKREVVDSKHRCHAYKPTPGHTWAEILEEVDKRWGG